MHISSGFTMISLLLPCFTATRIVVDATRFGVESSGDEQALTLDHEASQEAHGMSMEKLLVVDADNSSQDSAPARKLTAQNWLNCQQGGKGTPMRFKCILRYFGPKIWDNQSKSWTKPSLTDTVICGMARPNKVYQTSKNGCSVEQQLGHVVKETRELAKGRPPPVVQRVALISLDETDLDLIQGAAGEMKFLDMGIPVFSHGCTQSIMGKGNESRQCYRDNGNCRECTPQAAPKVVSAGSKSPFASMNQASNLGQKLAGNYFSRPTSRQLGSYVELVEKLTWDTASVGDQQHHVATYCFDGVGPTGVFMIAFMVNQYLKRVPVEQIPVWGDKTVPAWGNALLQVTRDVQQTYHPQAGNFQEQEGELGISRFTALTVYLRDTFGKSESKDFNAELGFATTSDGFIQQRLALEPVFMYCWKKWVGDFKGNVPKDDLIFKEFDQVTAEDNEELVEQQPPQDADEAPLRYFSNVAIADWNPRGQSDLPQNLTYLTLKKEDEIVAEQAYDNGWWYGYKTTDPEHKGLFPPAFIVAKEDTFGMTQAGQYCPYGKHISDEEDCKSAALAFRLEYAEKWYDPENHQGCYFAEHGDGRVYFNTAATKNAEANAAAASICKNSVIDPTWLQQVGQADSAPAGSGKKADKRKFTAF